MDRKSTLIIAGILILAVIGFIFISLTKKSTLDTSVPTGQTNIATSSDDWVNTPAQNPEGNQQIILTAKHAYQQGAHIVAGELPLPTPCHILDAQMTVSSDQSQILLALTSTVKGDALCAQVITPARFKVSAKANKDAHISATLNGQAITLNLIEAGPDEDLDNFELYIKG